MNTREFLERVVPNDGFIYLGEPRKKNDKSYWFHTTFETAADAVKHIRGRHKQDDIYFACASYSERLVFNKKRKKETPRRTKDNVKLLKAFWLDIDAGAGKPYPTIEEAARGLLSFVSRTALPQPSMIVASGGGLHVYWTLDKPIDRATWEPMAAALKRCCAHQGLKADPARTADCASVLRPIHAMNHKHGAPVRLLRSNPDVPLAALITALEPYQSEDFDLPRRQRPLAAKQSGPNSDLSAGLSHGPQKVWSTAKITARCPVMATILDERGANCPEPLWKATLHLISFTDDGADFAHPLSDGHPGYNAADTDEKYRQRFEVDRDKYGPTTCAQFAEHMPEKCATCPFRGTIRSPIVLGDDRDPRFPPGYRITDDGWLEHYEKESEDEGIWERAFPYMIQEVSLFANPDTDTAGIVARFILGSCNARIEITGEDLADFRTFRRLLGSRGVTADEKPCRRLMIFMSGFMRQLQELRSNPVSRVARFGWYRDKHRRGFAIGTTLLLPNGHETEEVQNLAGLTHIYEPAGTLEGWKAAADIITHQEHPPLLALLASGFAAPLIGLMGMDGVLLSVRSPESGVGKTTVARIAQAIWGHPVEGMFQLNDTANSVDWRLGHVNSLPVYWDELQTDRTVQSVIELIFRLSQGKTKSRLTASIRPQESYTWQTMMVACSNGSIFSAMSYRSNAQAGMMRTFEIVVPPREDSRLNARLQDTLLSVREHYGHAGRVYARYLLDHEEEVRNLLSALRDRVQKTMASGQEERFWVATIAAIVGGAILAKRAGLVNINADAVARFLIASAARLRGAATTTVIERSPMELLAAYVSDRHSNFVVTDRISRPRRGKPDPVKLVTVAQRAPLAGQFARDEDVYRIIKRPFEDWLVEHGEDPAAAIEGILRKARSSVGRMTIGAGTAHPIGARLLAFDISAGDITP